MLKANIFQSSFGNIRFIETEGGLWFSLRDVCRIILSNIHCNGKNGKSFDYRLSILSSKARSKISEVNIINDFFDDSGIRRRLIFVSRYGMYDYIYSPDSEIPEKFKEDFMNEILNFNGYVEPEPVKVEEPKQIEKVQPEVTSEIHIFSNPEFGKIRAVENDGNPWFIAKDIADALGFSNSRDAIRKHVYPDDKGVVKCDTHGGPQNLVSVNESGLYCLVFASKLPSAQEFKHWVTSEVLPNIRKTGGYISGQEELTDDELMARALEVAHRTIASRDKRIAQLEEENAVASEKAGYYDTFVEKNLLTGFQETAKELGISSKLFVETLIQKKYIFRRGGKLLPYAEKNHGYFEVKERKNDRTGWVGTQTFVTPAGKMKLKELFRENDQYSLY